ncbi:2296_t:CDS:2, partial [Funneliformis mosseae]
MHELLHKECEIIKLQELLERDFNENVNEDNHYEEELKEEEKLNNPNNLNKNITD